MSDAAITTIVSGAVTVTLALIGFWKLKTELRHGVAKTEEVASQTRAVERKIDDNTTITVSGNQMAASNAAAAANVASAAKTAVDHLDQKLEKKLNGGIDAAVAQAVEPVHAVLREHTARIEELNRYVHQRNHDLLGALQTQTNQIAAVLEMLKQQAKGGA